MARRHGCGAWRNGKREILARSSECDRLRAAQRAVCNLHVGRAHAPSGWTKRYVDLASGVDGKHGTAIVGLGEVACGRSGDCDGGNRQDRIARVG